MRFKGKTVIVTGAAGGIGLAISKRFYSEGAMVVMADINKEKTAAAIGESWNGHYYPVACDVSNEEAVSHTVNETISRFGSVDIIVNNAGLMMFMEIEKQTAADWKKILDVDLLGAFYFIKHGFLHMKKGSSIINISSIHALETTPLVSSYAAAKAALLSLTRSASIEGGSKGIRVNAILPGAIDTPMLWDNPNIKSGLETINKDSVGRPEDIAGVAAFLASEDAAFVQGAMIEVDGGRIDRL